MESIVSQRDPNQKRTLSPSGRTISHKISADQGPGINVVDSNTAAHDGNSSLTQHNGNPNVQAEQNAVSLQSKQNRYKLAKHGGAGSVNERSQA